MLGSFLCGTRLASKSSTVRGGGKPGWPLGDQYSGDAHGIPFPIFLCRSQPVRCRIDRHRARRSSWKPARLLGIEKTQNTAPGGLLITAVPARWTDRRRVIGVAPVSVKPRAAPGPRAGLGRCCLNSLPFAATNSAPASFRFTAQMRQSSIGYGIQSSEDGGRAARTKYARRIGGGC
jgi:hypothetical protein